MIGKTLSFPWWLEASLIVLMGVMAVVEWRGDSWGWALVFGAGCAAFGISAVARAFSGENHDRS
jgi:hypothetical protein